MGFWEHTEHYTVTNESLLFTAERERGRERDLNAPGFRVNSVMAIAS